MSRTHPTPTLVKKKSALGLGKQHVGKVVSALLHLGDIHQVLENLKLDVGLQLPSNNYRHAR